MKTAVRATAGLGKTKRRRLSDRKSLKLLLLAAPVIIYVFIFNYLPMGGIILAFKDYNYASGILGSKWVGLENFKHFFQSNAALKVTLNTLGYNFVFIILGTVLNLAVALLLNEIRNRSAIKYYQTTMFFPYFLSWVVVAYILYGFISPAYGVFNKIVEALGGQVQNWYQYPKAWPAILVIAHLWKGMGMGVLINYAVLIGIDPSYYEAAAVDGAKKWQMVWNISLPFVVPVVVMQIILAIGKIFFADFGLFYQLPQNSAILQDVTDVIDTYVYRMLIDRNEIGISSAVGLYQSFVGLILIVITNKIVSKIDEDSALF